MNHLNPGAHICIIGTAHLGQKNPIYNVHEKLLLILVVERETGTILDCDVNMICDLTRRFVQAMYLGRNIVTDIDNIRDCIQKNYFGDSAKALMIATRAARAKYLEVTKAT